MTQLYKNPIGANTLMGFFIFTSTLLIQTGTVFEPYLSQLYWFPYYFPLSFWAFFLMSMTSIQSAAECTTQNSQRMPPVWPDRIRLTTTGTQVTCKETISGFLLILYAIRIKKNQPLIQHSSLYTPTGYSSKTLKFALIFDFSPHTRKSLLSHRKWILEASQRLTESWNTILFRLISHSHPSITIIIPDSPCAIPILSSLITVKTRLPPCML